MKKETHQELKLKNFLKWCEDNNIIMNNAELRYVSDDCGYGIYAKQYIRPNECILHVPKDMMITAGLVANIPKFEEILKKNYNLIKLEPFDVLVLFFYLESINETSTWKPYLDMLPQQFSTPLYSLDEIDLNQLTLYAKNKIVKQIKEVEQMKEKFTKILEDEIDEERFLWSWHVVNTRCIHCDNQQHPLLDDVKDNLSIIPLMDMMNHNTNNTCLPGYDKYHQSYRVISSKFVDENEQLFVCYGSHDNSKLWIEYGFTLENNIFNKVDISIDLFLILASKIGFEFNKKNENVIHETSIPCTLYASDEGISYGLKKNCIILSMTKSELKDWQRIIYDVDDEIRIQKAEQLAKKILEELSIRLQAKCINSHPSYQWLWNNQIDIIEFILKTG